MRADASAGSHLDMIIEPWILVVGFASVAILSAVAVKFIDRLRKKDVESRHAVGPARNGQQQANILPLFERPACGQLSF